MLLAEKRRAYGKCLSCLVLGLTVLCRWPLLAQVNVTEPIAANDVSCDKCLNSTNGAVFVVLDNIVIVEGTTGDFSFGNFPTFILTLPAGWQFKAGVVRVSFSGGDITNATI